ncbi:site-specific integrase [Pseudomonas sp. LG1E9]|uniref:site-specific integrase n=1 Tax=Pseudomonas sp. LG1E9 TaxID=2219057 RepID=UPI000DD2FC73|nr:site-specific integrase [Pseudomonas sp. LG1E9]
MSTKTNITTRANISSGANNSSSHSAHSNGNFDSAPVDYWELLNDELERLKNTSVSQASFFWQNTWDFRKEGLGYLINFESIVGSSARTHFPLVMVLKLIAFCLLGRHAITERSPRTVYNIFSSAKEVVAWLGEHGCLVAQHDGGYFKLPRELAQDQFQDVLNAISSSGFHDNTKWDKVRLLSEWWKLSIGDGLLPSFLRLASDPFDGKRLVDFKDFEPDEELALPEDVSGWQAIPLEYAFPIANAALEYVEKYSAPLIQFYQVIYEGIVQHNSGSIVTKGRLEKTCVARGISFEELSHGLPFKFEFSRYAAPSYPDKFTYRLDRKDAERSLSHIKRAAITIILFTTGMRSWEIRNLRVGCCVPDLTMGVEDFYRLTVTVRKTSREYEQGQVISIPVPKTTYQAVKVLEALGTLKRREDYLLTPLQSNEKSDHVSGQLNTQSLVNYVKAFARDIGVDYEPHPHQFRKTIAGWFVMNSPVLGPLLVMRLFSHRSMNMTEMYLRNNPLIVEARQEVLVEQSLKIVNSIGRSAQDGKLAGGAGERLKSGIQQDPIFEGITGDELGATMREYLRERAMHGSMHFLLTPLSICAFDPNDETEKPCVNLIPAIQLDEITASPHHAGGLPFVSKCVGAKCDHCLITQFESQALEQSMGFYKSLIAGAIDEDYAQNLHIMASAREFVELYTPILESVK